MTLQSSNLVDQFADHYGGLKPQLPGAGLGWLGQLRDDGMAAFQASGMPTAKAEDWRYTNLRAMTKSVFQPAGADGVPASVAVDSGAAHRLVFVNGLFRPDLSHAGDLPAGARLSPLSQALEDRPDLLEPHLGRLLSTEDASLVALNMAMMRDGFVLHLGPGVRVDDPIEMLFISSAAAGAVHFHPRGLILLEEGCAATVVEDHVGQSGSYFSNCATEIDIATAASLRHYKLQDEALDAFHTHATIAKLGHDARYESFVLSVGAALSRHEIRVALAGEGAACRLDGAYLAAGGQQVTNRTLVNHLAPAASSSQVYKGVLDDRAQAAFLGTIKVWPDAQLTDGHQLNKAILLSDKAEIDTKPELLIHADDVKCSHGATAGELDGDALFYLRSRGIAEAAARAMLIEAFLADVIEHISFSVVRDAYRERAAAWMTGRARENEQ